MAEACCEESQLGGIKLIKAVIKAIKNEMTANMISNQDRCPCH